MKEIVKNLENNLQIFFKTTKAKKAIIGVSGGVDSACVLSIAVKALGSDKVFALLMPHKDYSSAENLKDARDLVQKLGIEYREIEISKYAKTFFDNCEFAKTDYAKANLMSRIRMILLYAVANSMSGIVLGTSNKTEILTGFFTKYGDGGIDIEVIGELWKTEIYELAEYLQIGKFAKKRPTAELFHNHFDEEEIGVNYPEIDEILKKIIKAKNFKPNSHKEEKVFSLYKDNFHKRIPPPVISIKSA